MAVEVAVRNLLLADGAVTLLLGGRLSPLQAPEQSVYPCVVYTDAGRESEMTYGGPILTDKYTMTFQTYGDAYGSTKAAARAIRRRLNGFAGDVAEGRVLGIFPEDESDALDQPLFDTDRGIYYVTLTVTVVFQALTPAGN